MAASLIRETCNVLRRRVGQAFAHRPAMTTFSLPGLRPSLGLGAILVACTFSSLGCASTAAGSAQADASNGGDGSNHADTDAGACMISASNYDQSCAADTDCQEVTSRDYCVAGCLCGGSAVNAGALAQFNADVSKTPLGSGALGGAACPCADQPGPCCRSGKCTMACFSPTDTLPACADAGGMCLLRSNAICGSANSSSGAQGLPDACAYSDEICCIN